MKVQKLRQFLIHLTLSQVIRRLARPSGSGQIFPGVKFHQELFAPSAFIGESRQVKD